MFAVVVFVLKLWFVTEIVLMLNILGVAEIVNELSNNLIDK